MASSKRLLIAMEDLLIARKYDFLYKMVERPSRLMIAKEDGDPEAPERRAQATKVPCRGFNTLFQWS
jgi:hypothetical protein